ncbi:hypothetical protein M0638_11020 [Roseomonas sp. NAR14]|uniref:Uncharacterized protein n=1 Tax=Roseomonas acroporae TaxID=2937791 RepID=A0A9X1Y895_9PROT|nr:hypothetical protein [Roseomonas acroporae]MCK8784912.1 hypothetical protein [Roseomonas acroporae]
MRPAQFLRSAAVLALAAISVLAVVVFVALRLGVISPAEAGAGVQVVGNWQRDPRPGSQGLRGEQQVRRVIPAMIELRTLASRTGTTQDGRPLLERVASRTAIASPRALDLDAVEVVLTETGPRIRLRCADGAACWEVHSYDGDDALTGTAQVPVRDLVWDDAGTVERARDRLVSLLRAAR